MNGLFDGLKADSYDRVYSNWYLLKRISVYLKPRLSPIVTTAILIVLISALTSIIPVLIARGIDRIEEQNIRQFALTLCLLILGAVLISWVMNFVQQIITAKLVAAIVYQLQKETFDAVLAKDMFFFDQHGVGKIVSRVTADTEAFSSVLTLTLNFISQFVLVIIISAILCYINLYLAGFALALSPLIIVAALAFRHIGRKATQQTRRVMAFVNANVHESMSGISIAKNFGRESKLYNEFEDVNELSYRVYTRQGLIYGAIHPILNALSGFGLVIVLYVGGLTSIKGGITPGNWYFFIHALALLWVPLTQVASFWSLFQLGLAAGERIFAFVDSDDSIKQTENKSIDRIRGAIEFKSIDFHYSQNKQVYKNLNFSIKEGEKIALVGHTGSGKSSIAKLIARFYEFQNGEILIDGQDIRTLKIGEYRNCLGIVPQHSFLFSGTVGDNIGYVKTSASKEEILKAASQVGNGDWLDNLPMGIDTVIVENGKGLSMGQKQMIALARVFLKKPSLIIFDEATASIDPLAEAQIQESLNDLFLNRTAIIIAHRLLTIQNTDRIIAIDNGKIIEQGSHDQLLSQGGYYAELYNTYYKHQESDL